MQLKEVEHIAILVVPNLAIRRHPEDPHIDAVHLTVDRPDCSTRRAVFLACCKAVRHIADAIITLISNLIADYLFLLHNYLALSDKLMHHHQSGHLLHLWSQVSTTLRPTISTAAFSFTFIVQKKPPRREAVNYFINLDASTNVPLPPATAGTLPSHFSNALIWTR